MQQRGFGEGIRRVLGRYTVIILLVGIIVLFSAITPQRFLSGGNIQNLSTQVPFDVIIALGEMVVLISDDRHIGWDGPSDGGCVDIGHPVAWRGDGCGGQPAHGHWCRCVQRSHGDEGADRAVRCDIGFDDGRIWGATDVARGKPITGQADWFAVFGNGTLGPVPVPAILMLVVLLMFHVVLTYTEFGRHMYAVGGNREATRLAGVQVDRYRFWAFVLSSSCSAFAGVLLASRLNSASIHMGQQTPLFVIAGCVVGGASIFGGRGSAIGAFLGILALSVLGDGLDLLGVFTYYQTAIRAIVFILVVAVEASYATALRTERRRLPPFLPSVMGVRHRPRRKGEVVSHEVV